jgi:hypothetical protein
VRGPGSGPQVLFRPPLPAAHQTSSQGRSAGLLTRKGASNVEDLGHALRGHAALCDPVIHLACHQSLCTCRQADHGLACRSCS